jgi:hypothetical protein
MSAVNPAAWCQGRTDHPASLFRMMLAGLIPGAMTVGSTAPGGGVNPYFGSRLGITGLASMNVTVGTGLVYLPATTAWSGMYAAYNNASFTIGIAAASSTQWRTDLVYATMTDPGDGTAAWSVAVATGTNSSTSPGATPALPSNSVPLALIRVTPNMTVTNGGGTVVDNRTYSALQGTLITTSSAKPSTSMPNGTTWYETDTQALGVIINGAIAYIPTMAQVRDSWHAFNPLVTGFSVPAGGYAQYRKTPDNELQLSANIATTTGTGVSAWTQINSTVLPAGYRPAHAHPFNVAPDIGSISSDGTRPATPRGYVGTGGDINLISIAPDASVIQWEVRIPLDV